MHTPPSAELGHPVCSVIASGSQSPSLLQGTARFQLLVQTLLHTLMHTDTHAHTDTHKHTVDSFINWAQTVHTVASPSLVLSPAAFHMHTYIKMGYGTLLVPLISSCSGVPLTHMLPWFPSHFTPSPASAAQSSLKMTTHLCTPAHTPLSAAETHGPP